MFRIHRRWATLLAKLRPVHLLVSLGWLLLCPFGLAFGQEAPAEVADGQYIYVRNPINSDVVSRVKAQVRRFLDRGEHPGAKIVFDFNPQGYPSSTSEYGFSMSRVRGRTRSSSADSDGTPEKMITGTSVGVAITTSRPDPRRNRRSITAATTRFFRS